jgi:hypothetical protein
MQLCMKSIYYPVVAAALLLAPASYAQAQAPPTERRLVASPAVGETIDRAEKSKFGLFPFYSADEFVEATFYRALSADSLITLRTRLADGRTVARPFTQPEFLAVRSTIERRAKELGETIAPPAPLAVGTAAEPVSATDYPFQLGKSYRIETKSGGTFTGELSSMSLNSVELTSTDGSTVNVPRNSFARVVPLDGGVAAKGSSSATHRPGYFDIGNGTRLFNAPTGRGLRKGEGTVQSTYLFLVGAEYGITDNFSVGASLSLLPGLALSQQLFIISPRFSAPLSEKVHVGAGIIYANIPFDNSNSGGAGIGYGSLTYGGADDNLTFGIGYGFTSGEIGNTPVLQLGGQKRVSRRLSLVTENYVIADAQAGMGGLYGVKIHGRHVSVGVGAAYVYIYAHTETDYNYYYDPNTGMYISMPYNKQVSGQFGTTYVIPVYADFAYRFGGKK